MVFIQLTGSSSHVFVELLEVCLRPFRSFLWRKKKQLTLKDIETCAKLTRLVQTRPFSLLILHFQKIYARMCNRVTSLEQII